MALSDSSLIHQSLLSVADGSGHRITTTLLYREAALACSRTKTPYTGFSREGYQSTIKRTFNVCVSDRALLRLSTSVPFLNPPLRAEPSEIRCHDRGNGRFEQIQIQLTMQWPFPNKVDEATPGLGREPICALEIGEFSLETIQSIPDDLGRLGATPEGEGPFSRKNPEQCYEVFAHSSLIAAETPSGLAVHREGFVDVAYSISLHSKLDPSSIVLTPL
jgi:hypothetical protein